MVFYRFFFICFCSLIFLQGYSFSQDNQDSLKTYTLSGVVITATKTQTPAVEVASSISVITRRDIENSKKIFAFDLLKDQPGISFTQQGGIGKFASVFIRGGNAGHTLVLVDGVEVNMPNDPGNSVDFSSIPVDDLERIEILRGPQSTLYGSDALAGVINILSKKGEGKPKLFLSGEGGAYSTYKGSAGINGGYNIFNYALTFNRVTSRGFSAAGEKYGNTERDGFSGSNISARAGADISDELGLSVIYKHIKTNTDYDMTGGNFGDDTTAVANAEQNIFRVEGNFKNGLLESKAGFSYFRNVRKDNSISADGFYDGTKTKFDLQNNLNFTPDNVLTFGVETEEEKAYTEYFSAYGNSILPVSKARTTGGYIQAKFGAMDEFFGSAGIRYDHHDKFGSKITYRIAPAFIYQGTGTKFKATFGTGFKTPSLVNLFDPLYGNTSLKPEQSTGWDAGIEQYINFSGKHDYTRSDILVGITYFSNSYKDLYGFDAILNKTININKAKTDGVEVYLTAVPKDNISVEANYTFTNAKDLSPGSADYDKPLIRRPKHKASLDLNYRAISPLNTNIEVLYIGNRDDKDYNQYPTQRVTLKNYTLVNAAVSYDLTGYIQVYSRVENLLNVDYEEVLGYGTAKISLYGGVRVHL